MTVCLEPGRLLEILRAASVIAVAALIGSLPAGVLLGRRFAGQDIRRVSPHNLGLGTVVAAVGLPVLAAAVALDFLKGLAAVALTGLLGASGWVMAGGAAGAVAGHTWLSLWPAAPRVGARSKGIAVALGSLAALVLLRSVSLASLAIPLVVAVAALVLPGLLGGGSPAEGAGRRWGYLSLAAVLGAVSLPVVLWLEDAETPYVALGLFLAALTLWHHKEHLGRIADGTEPRVGERLPHPALGGEVACAFLIHPMSVEDNLEAGRFRWMAPLRRLGLASDGLVRRAARLMRPMKVDEIRPVVTADGRRARVYLIGVPLLPDQIRGEPALAVLRAVQAADLAANLGATVLGLGAYWSVVGNKGIEVQQRSSIAVTNGGAYTAGTVQMAVPLILERLRERGADPSRAAVGVVGANGVVGFGICRQIAPHVSRLIMVGTDPERLERSSELILRRHAGLRIETTTELDRLREADAVFTATSSPEPVVFPRHVREGCLLIDLGRPFDVAPEVGEMAGVEVIPGGVVRLPGDPRWRIDLGYGPGLVPACLAETLILAVEGCYDRASLGPRTRAEDVEFLVERGRALGLQVQTRGRLTAV